MPYKILEVTPGQGSSLGGPSEDDSVSSLSTSSTLRLKNAYPGGLQHTDEASTYGRENYRQLYKEQVLDGNNENYKAQSLNGASHSRNYVDNGPPGLETISELEEASSTIVPSGLGPNTNVGPAMAAIGWQVIQGTEELVPNVTDIIDPSSNSEVPFTGDGKASPDVTSAQISESILHAQPMGKSQSSGGA